jgi:hypothetical protein
MFTEINFIQTWFRCIYTIFRLIMGSNAHNICTYMKEKGLKGDVVVKVRGLLGKPKGEVGGERGRGGKRGTEIRVNSHK